MTRYAFYTYDFGPGTAQLNAFDGKRVPFSQLSVGNCQQRLDFQFGKNGEEFRIQRSRKDDADPYPCTVMAHIAGITLLRIEKPKNVKIFKKQEASKGNIASITKKWETSSPFNYVIIDCREGHNLIAISIDSDAWSNTDTVGNMLQESINHQFELMALDISIGLTPQYLCRDFVEYSRFLIKKKKRRVTKMTFFFSGGTIDPQIEAIIRKDRYLSGLNNRNFNSKHTEVSYIDPDSASIIRKNSQTLEHFVTLVMSNPNSDAFRLRMTYDDGTTLNCGKRVRIEYEMSDQTFMSLLGYGSLFKEEQIGNWLDDVVRLIEEERNAG